MATQSLYRRFRPRRFSELHGQDHVVRALRNAVANQREGQAYLFSGPRGTGKTSTARILAKVLNCESPTDGEPCCECASCKAVEMGASYDVLELDAASHNGVQEIRDIIDAAALTSPGRHRVFILDEVHMLTRAAEAALLKTLEEPPEQVVFVLATTDPQKVSETIRSRVQHLQFHLLPLDDLERYVRHVVAEAGLEVTDDDIETVLRQGGGSARDTLSALELVASGGADTAGTTQVDAIVRAIIDRDHGSALAAVATATKSGRDPQAYAQDVLGTMRDCFLSLMSPELVMLPSARVDELSGLARELGAQRIVKAMETLGETLIEMRHAPDSRLLLEVAIVRLSSPSFDDSTENLLARIGQLEEAVKSLKEHTVAAALPPAPVDPATGRAKIGGRVATNNPTNDVTGPTVAPNTPPARSAATTSQSQPATNTEPNRNPVQVDGAQTDSAQTESAKVDVAAAPDQGSQTSSGDPVRLWPQITESMRGIAKAMFKPAIAESFDGKVLMVKLPANTPVKRAHEHEKTLVAAVKSVCGVSCVVKFSQSDPTSGTPRPSVDNEPKTIDKIVADDPLAPIDLAETVMATDAVDPVLAKLQEEFPGGAIIDDDTTSQR